MDSHADTTDWAAFTRAAEAELRRRREERGWSQEQLSRHLPPPLDSDTVRAHETDAHGLTVYHFVRTCMALGEEPHSVLEHILDRVESSED